MGRRRGRAGAAQSGGGERTAGTGARAAATVGAGVPPGTPPAATSGSGPGPGPEPAPPWGGRCESGGGGGRAAPLAPARDPSIVPGSGGTARGSGEYQRPGHTAAGTGTAEMAAGARSGVWGHPRSAGIRLHRTPPQSPPLLSPWRDSSTAAREAGGCGRWAPGGCPVCVRFAASGGGSFEPRRVRVRPSPEPGLEASSVPAAAVPGRCGAPLAAGGAWPGGRGLFADFAARIPAKLPSGSPAAPRKRWRRSRDRFRFGRRIPGRSAGPGDGFAVPRSRRWCCPLCLRAGGGGGLPEPPFIPTLRGALGMLLLPTWGVSC